MTDLPAIPIDKSASDELDRYMAKRHAEMPKRLLTQAEVPIPIPKPAVVPQPPEVRFDG